MIQNRAKKGRLRLDPASYRRLWAKVLTRDGWRCQRCGRSSNLQVHHIRRRSLLGNDGEEKPHHFVRELSPGSSSTPVHELLTKKSTVESSSCNTFTFLACVCSYTGFFIPNIRSWEERGALPRSLRGATFDYWVGVGEACSRSRMLPYCALSAGMLFSFQRAVCPQKRRHNHGSTVREAQREETHDQCAQDCPEAHEGQKKNLQESLSA